jgi:hypothetical protein
MHLHRVQFTIQSLMIAVVIGAGLLALPRGLREVTAVLSLPLLAVYLAGRLLDGGHRRLAAIGFWGLAIPVNFLFVAFCASPGMLSVGLFFLWLFVILPTLAAFGATWAVLETRWAGGPHPLCRLAWTWVVALAVMPGVTAWTVWPFRLRFLTARSALERVADQVEAGQAVAFPRNAGPFRLAVSRVDSQSQGVALLIDADPGGPSGFVRHTGSLTGPYSCFRPIRGDWWHLRLGGGWCFAAHNAVGLAGESPAVGIDCLPT